MGLKANLQAFNNKSDLDDSNVTFYSETSSKGHKYEIGILLHKIYKELNDSETTYFKDYKFLNISFFYEETLLFVTNLINHYKINNQINDFYLDDFKGWDNFTNKFEKIRIVILKKLEDFLKSPITPASSKNFILLDKPQFNRHDLHYRDRFIFISKYRDE